MSLSVLIGSTPGVAVIVLLWADSYFTALATAVIVVLTMAAYYSSLRYAGSAFERRIDIISRRGRDRHQGRPLAAIGYAGSAMQT